MPTTTDRRRGNRPGPMAAPTVRRVTLTDAAARIARAACYARIGRAGAAEVSAHVSGVIEASADPRVILATVEDAAALVPWLAAAAAACDDPAAARGIDALIAAAASAASRSA